MQGLSQASELGIEAGVEPLVGHLDDDATELIGHDLHSNSSDLTE